MTKYFSNYLSYKTGIVDYIRCLKIGVRRFRVQKVHINLKLSLHPNIFINKYSECNFYPSRDCCLGYYGPKSSRITLSSFLSKLLFLQLFHSENRFSISISFKVIYNNLLKVKSFNQYFHYIILCFSWLISFLRS